MTTRIIGRRLASISLVACLLATTGAAATAQPASPTPAFVPEPSAQATPGAPPLSGVWKVVAFDAWGEGLTPPRAGRSWTAEFLTDGRLEGSTACGTYVGGYSIDGERLGMGIISKGPEPCDVETTEQAVDYSVALEAVASWRATLDGVELLDEGGAVRVLLARSEDADPSGDWTVTRYARANGKPARPIAEAPILVTFGDDGSLRGSSGCRLFEGQYSSQADQIVVAPVEPIGLPCEGDAKPQERRLLRIFDLAVLWQRDGDRLVLADAAGTALLELAAVTESPPASPSEMPVETGG